MKTFLDWVKEDENARSIFGKRELEIIEKQLLGINLTGSEKTRLSRDIKKKLKAIGEASKFVKEFEIKKGAEIKNIVAEVKQVILEDELFKKIEKIYLFGSVVENKLSFRSDIDIAVKFDKISLREATKFRIRISGDVSDKIDIQVYNVLPGKIKREIDKKSKVLYLKWVGLMIRLKKLKVI